MTNLIASLVAAGMLFPAAVYAQTAGGSNASSPPVNAQASGSNQRALANAEKIKQDLQSAGFTDVNIVAESFVVQAKTKDGDPVVMTIGPHGMTVFETVTAGKAGTSSTTGSTGSSGTSGTSSHK